MFSLLPDSQHYFCVGFDEVEMLTRYPDAEFLSNLAPVSWRANWLGLTLHFYDARTSKLPKHQPDITVFEKRLFMSPNAKMALEPLLQGVGEYLPVTCKDRVDETAFIFNPLKTVQVNTALSFRDDYETKAIVFDCSTAPLVFKTEFDDFVRIFCTAEFKEVVEAHCLKGLSFQDDLASVV